MRARSPAEALLLGVPIRSLLLSSCVREGSEAARVPGVRGRLGVFLDCCVPSALGELELLAGAVNAHLVRPGAC